MTVYPSEADRATTDSAHQAGFMRCMYLLRKASPPADLYSPEMQSLLRAYFGTFAKHKNFSVWWQDHLGARVAHALGVFLPWLERQIDVRDKVVLEIGCGTGSSTVALACQARRVIVVDMHGPSISVARQRVKEDGFADFVTFQKIDPLLRNLECVPSTVDVVVCYAVLEHMLPAERSAVIDRIWATLTPGGHLVVYETPNRLWPFDLHTTGLWWWPWMPPRLALWYGQYRGRFPRTYALAQMYREGYGLTYRELEALFAGKDYLFLNRAASEALPRRVVASFAAHLLHQPRWALARNFDCIIRKLPQS